MSCLRGLLSERTRIPVEVVQDNRRHPQARRQRRHRLANIRVYEEVEVRLNPGRYHRPTRRQLGHHVERHHMR